MVYVFIVYAWYIGGYVLMWQMILLISLLGVEYALSNLKEDLKQPRGSTTQLLPLLAHSYLFFSKTGF